jgi:hypothetical protein
VKPQQTYEEWRKTHPPIMGASEAAPAAENGTQPTDQQTTDPWTSTLEGVDEVYRPHVEQAINPLREQFGPRLELADRLEPLSDYADDLLALHGMADEDGTALQDFLGFAQMASQVDPENPDSEANQAFAEWFYEIGDQLGLLDPDNEDEEADPDDPEDGDKPNAEVEELRGIIGQLQARVEQAEAAPRIQSVQQEINGLIEKAVDDHRLGGSNDEDRQKIKDAIVRFANDYKDDASLSNAEMVNKAVQDVLVLRGGAQTELLGGDENVERVVAGASPGNGVPDTRPEEIATGDPKESRRRAKAAALSRLGG